MTFRSPSLLATATLALTLPTLPAMAQNAQPPANPPAPAPAPAPAGPPAGPPAPVEKKIDAAAKKALDDMAAAQQALKSYSATLKFSIQQGDKTQNVTSEIAYALPNKVQTITTPPTAPGGTPSTLRVVSDGRMFYMLNSATPKTFRVRDVQPDIKNIIAGIGASGAGTGLMRLLLTEKQASDRILGPDTSVVEFAPNETVEGVECRVVKATLTRRQGPAVTISFAIGKDDTLLRRVVINQSAPQGNFVVTESYADVKVNPDLAPALFAYTPPPDAKPEEEPKEQAYYDQRLKVGAAPLPLSGKDMTGKAVTLADYKGKVVLLDFWATWCGPCVAEIPNVVKVYNKYHGQGFEVLGISLDQADSKDKVVSFTKEQKMPWKQIYDGGGWQSALATAYSVKAIPFTLLVGKDGKIVAVGARGEDLEPAVKKALAAK